MQLIVGLFLVVVLVLVSVSLSADSDIDSQVFRGKDAKDGQFPYHVGIFLVFFGDTYYNCGGSIISNTFIITAAHCIPGKVGDIRVFMGSIHNRLGRESTPRNKIVHPDYNERIYWLGNDIGLLEIDPISYSDGIEAINLPPLSDTHATYEGHIAIVSGWGYTNGSLNIPGILQFTHLIVISNTACAKANRKEELNEDIVCAADPDGSAGCPGDSGGPLVDMDSRNLIGIVSFGPTSDCRTIHFGSAFTRITHHRQWIKDHTGV